VVAIPAVLIATWRRNVVSEQPQRPGLPTLEQRAFAKDASSEAEHELAPG
jgi:hypothetical protein